MFDSNSQRRIKPPVRSTSVHETHVHSHGEHDEEQFGAFATMWNDDDDYEMENTESFGSFSVHETNVTRPPYRRPSLRKEVWQSLSRPDQMIWDSMSDKGKISIILGSRPRQTTTPVSTKTIPPQRQVNITETTLDQGTSGSDDVFHDADPGILQDTDDSLYVNAAKRGNTSHLSPPDVRRLLSPSDKDTKPKNTLRRQANLHHITYSVSNKVNRPRRGALVDRGANGGLAGPDVRVISKTDRSVDITGIDNHEIVGLPIVTAGAVVPTDQGPVILVMHQFAHMPQGKTILSSAQLEHFGTIVDDRSTRVSPPGSQSICTLDGYSLPLNFYQGLPYLQLRPFTDHEWNTLPHVIVTSDQDWDPSVLDHNVHDDHGDTWYDPPSHSIPLLTHGDFDTFGTYTGIEVHSAIQHGTMRHDSFFHAYAGFLKPSNTTFMEYAPYFLLSPPEVIQKTFEATTQYARSGWITGHIHQTHRAPFPALNVRRRNEPVATDLVYSDTPAIDNGATSAQIFVGLHSKFASVYSMRTDTQFANTLMDVIRHHGAMDVLISDSARSEMSHKVRDILRHLCIDDWQSEPEYQHQNAAERRYQNIKHNVNRTLNSTGAPPSTWFLCMRYVIFIMNRMAVESLSWRTPFEQLTGSTPDISMIYRFKFWDRVLFERTESRGGVHFPSQSNEAMGRFVGFSEHIGHPMTYLILTPDTSKIIYRSRIKLFEVDPNLRLLQEINDDPDRTDTSNDNGNDTVNGETSDKDTQDDVVMSRPRPLPILDADELIGRSFLSQPTDEGHRSRIRVVEALDDLETQVQQDPNMIRFRCSNDMNTMEEILTYGQIMDKLESPDGTNDEWHFQSIQGHEGPLTPSHPDYKGSKWNVRILWEDGSTTSEPLKIIGASDPVTCAIYASENNLLHLDGWKRFAKLARRQKKLLRMANQAKLQSFRTAPVYMFGIQVPRNHQQAMELDAANGNTNWHDAEQKELQSVDSFGTFKDLGHKTSNRAPQGFKKINVHMVYAVKHDGRHKARLVAGGHLTETPVHSVYSSVVSLRGLRLTIFLGELNQLEVWCTDVGNAYLEAYTEEKVYIVAGPEFGPRQHHILIIVRALYGLKSSGLRWWERCSQVLLDMGFKPSKAEDDIWFLPIGDSHYEYIARYVDDLVIVSKDPQGLVDILTKRHSFNLKGTGPISYHLGADFYRDADGTLCMAPAKYIERMITNFKTMFGCPPKKSVSSPLEKNDHPELDTSPELNVDDTKKYQSMIGALQWAISLGRFDIATAVMTMSRFRTSPRVGHLERVKRIYGYLYKMKNGAIRFRTQTPDLSGLHDPEYDWERSIYGNVTEMIPDDAPTPLGKPVRHIAYVDANLLHDLVTGRSVTGILHFLNQTPIDWYTKRQSTVETATYGSEFVAARTMTEQVMDFRLTLRYLGVPLHESTFAFGDNKTVVDSASLPKSKLHKRHVILSYHRVREAIAAKILRFFHIPGDINPADILSKAWGYQQVWPILRPILFWYGDTQTLSEESCTQSHGE